MSRRRLRDDNADTFRIVCTGGRTHRPRVLSRITRQRGSRGWVIDDYPGARAGSFLSRPGASSAWKCDSCGAEHRLSDADLEHEFDAARAARKRQIDLSRRGDTHNVSKQ